MMYRICCGLSLFPAQCRRDGSPGGIRSCSRAAVASESPSDGWGWPGSGKAFLTIQGVPAADRGPPSSVPSSCSPQPPLAWERNESQCARGQSCPEVRWRSSQPPPLPPLQLDPVYTTDTNRGPDDEQEVRCGPVSAARSVKRSAGKVERERGEKIPNRRAFLRSRQ